MLPPSLEAGLTANSPAWTLAWCCFSVPVPAGHRTLLIKQARVCCFPPHLTACCSLWWLCSALTSFRKRGASTCCASGGSRPRATRACAASVTSWACTGGQPQPTHLQRHTTHRLKSRGGAGPAGHPVLSRACNCLRPTADGCTLCAGGWAERGSRITSRACMRLRLGSVRWRVQEAVLPPVVAGCSSAAPVTLVCSLSFLLSPMLVALPPLCSLAADLEVAQQRQAEEQRGGGGLGRTNSRGSGLNGGEVGGGWGGGGTRAGQRRRGGGLHCECPRFDSFPCSFKGAHAVSTAEEARFPPHRRAHACLPFCAAAGAQPQPLHAAGCGGGAPGRRTHRVLHSCLCSRPGGRRCGGSRFWGRACRGRRAGAACDATAGSSNHEPGQARREAAALEDGPGPGGVW
jgi:uncharacterized membrane protein YgcG